MLEKLIWISAVMVVGAKHKCIVGEVESSHADEVSALIRELAAAGAAALGVTLDGGVEARLLAYSRSVAHFPTAVKEVRACGTRAFAEYLGRIVREVRACGTRAFAGYLGRIVREVRACGTRAFAGYLGRNVREVRACGTRAFTGYLGRNVREVRACATRAFAG
eukprot:365396-Chlamydomonas_euryale.AAC.6